jgi:hypothetical protein
MKKRFNVTGVCSPNSHYMMDDTRRFNAIFQMVEMGEYFTINRPRQYGKTTMLFALAHHLQKTPDYLPIRLNFEAADVEHLTSAVGFAQMFLWHVHNDLQKRNPDLAHLAENVSLVKNEDLSTWISYFVKSVGKKVVLLIDEVDKSSNYRPFLEFLATLRNKYQERTDGEITFHSVVLAGVHDIKSLKFKLRNPDEAQSNSPWNIAADFKVAMEFVPAEIVYMLRQYSEAENVQMDFEAISERLYYYTSGYPFLISKLCKIIAEDLLPQKSDQSCWTLDDVEESVQLLLKEEQNTNFDSLIKNLENNEDLYQLVFATLVDGAFIPFNPDEPMIRLGRMYGIFKAGNPLQIHNRIYEQRIYNFMVAIRLRQMLSQQEYKSLGANYTLPDGSLDFGLVLRKFQSFMKEQYSKRDNPMKEREWRLIFLSFLKPIINGHGYAFKEVETSEEKRLDIVVTYLQWRYIIELKRWSGEKSHERGLNQLADYLDIHGVSEGWLLIFDTRETPTWEEQVIQHKDKQILAVWA